MITASHLFQRRFLRDTAKLRKLRGAINVTDNNDIAKFLKKYDSAITDHPLFQLLPTEEEK